MYAVLCGFLFFFKQKTAYEMRISDWSSDVCSSDLTPTRVAAGMLAAFGATPIGMPVPQVPESLSKGVIDGVAIPWEVTLPLKIEIGRASCGARVCQYV